MSRNVPVPGQNLIFSHFFKENTKINKCLWEYNTYDMSKYFKEFDFIAPRYWKVKIDCVFKG